MATAKGIAQALGVALVGVSSLDAVAWHAWAAGTRGALAVVADAMRREVYPVRYALDDAGVQRLEATAVKAQVAAEELAGEGGAAGAGGAAAGALSLTGDGLKKYAELFAPAGALLPEELWAPTGTGLLLALQAAWRAGQADPFDAARVTTRVFCCRCTRACPTPRKTSAFAWRKTTRRTLPRACRTWRRAAISAPPCTTRPCSTRAPMSTASPRPSCLTRRACRSGCGHGGAGHGLGCVERGAGCRRASAP